MNWQKFDLKISTVTCFYYFLLLVHLSVVKGSKGKHKLLNVLSTANKDDFCSHSSAWERHRWAGVVLGRFYPERSTLNEILPSTCCMGAAEDAVCPLKCLLEQLTLAHSLPWSSLGRPSKALYLYSQIWSAAEVVILLHSWFSNRERCCMCICKYKCFNRIHLIIFQCYDSMQNK